MKGEDVPKPAGLADLDLLGARRVGTVREPDALDTESSVDDVDVVDRLKR